MLSKRSIILDSLSTHRIDEGMIDSISKNSSSGSGDKLLKALLDCDMRTIPNKNLKSTTSFYNKSPFSEVDLIVKYEKLPSNDGRKCYIYHLTKGKKHYISISASSYNNSLDGLSRLFIYEAKDESVVDYIWDFVDKNRLIFDMDDMNSGLKDCKTVANTYRVFGSKLLSDVYGTASTSYILKDTKEVLGALFKSSVGLFKSDYKGFKYESDMSELTSSCVDYKIRFDEDVLYITFNFKDAETCKRIYTLICENRIRSNQLYSLYLYGNTDIGLEFYV